MELSWLLWLGIGVMLGGVAGATGAAYFLVARPMP